MEMLNTAVETPPKLSGDLCEKYVKLHPAINPANRGLERPLSLSVYE